MFTGLEHFPRWTGFRPGKVLDTKNEWIRYRKFDALG